MHCSLFEYLTNFPQHAENAINCQGQTDKLSKKCHKLPQLCKFLDQTDCLPRLNACSQRRFWVALDTILISCTSARFIRSPPFLLHNVQPNCEHEDIYHCRHNGWHSS